MAHKVPTVNSAWQQSCVKFLFCIKSTFPFTIYSCPQLESIRRIGPVWGFSEEPPFPAVHQPKVSAWRSRWQFHILKEWAVESPVSIVSVRRKRLSGQPKWMQVGCHVFCNHEKWARIFLSKIIHINSSNLWSAASLTRSGKFWVFSRTHISFYKQETHCMRLDISECWQNFINYTLKILLKVDWLKNSTKISKMKKLLSYILIKTNKL